MIRPWIKSLLLFTFILAGYLGGCDAYSTGDVAANEMLPISLLREGNFAFDEFVGPGLRAHLPYYFRTVSGTNRLRLPDSSRSAQPAGLCGG